MADKLNDLMQVIGKTGPGQSPSLLNKANAKKKIQVQHTWQKGSSGTIGSPMAKKVGRGKH